MTPNEQSSPTHDEGPLFVALLALAEVKSLLRTSMTEVVSSEFLQEIKNRTIKDRKKEIESRETILEELLFKKPLLKSSLLHPCIDACQISLLNKILERKEVDTEMLSSDHMTPLARAVKNLHLLIENGESEEEITIFREMIHILIDHGADIPKVFRLPENGQGNPLKIEFLPNLIPSNLINKPNKEGKTPLQSSLSCLRSLHEKKEIRERTNTHKLLENSDYILDLITLDINREIEIIKTLITCQADQNLLNEEEKIELLMYTRE